MDIAIPAPDVNGQLEKHLIAEFAFAVEQWSRYISTLAKWEDEHLLDNPAQESLAAHRRMVERLLAFGRFISLATEQPEFPDRKTAEMIVELEPKLKAFNEEVREYLKKAQPPK